MFDVEVTGKSLEFYVTRAKNRGRYVGKKWPMLDIEEFEGVALLGLTKALKTYDPNNESKCSFKTYMIVVVDNECGMWARKQKKIIDMSRLGTLKYMEDEIHVDKGSGRQYTLAEVLPDKNNKFRNDEKDIETFLTGLDKYVSFPGHRLMIPYIFSDKTQQEIADELGFAQSYVSRLKKGLNKRIEFYIEKEFILL